MSPMIYVAGGILFIFIMNCLGAGTVFLSKKPFTPKASQLFLGFAAGVMIAASIWALLIPAFEEAHYGPLPEWIPAIFGFLLGVLFLMLLDHMIPHVHHVKDVQEGKPTKAKRTTLLLWAIILHYIPEGIAIGLAFSLALALGGEGAVFASAIALSIGIGVHNFPESAVVSMLFKQEGLSNFKSFLLGSLAGTVDLAVAVLTLFLAAWLMPAMPWLLAFAAGAMMYVVIKEMIPEAQLGEHSRIGTMSVMIGFLFMLFLESVLGHAH